MSNNQSENFLCERVTDGSENYNKSLKAQIFTDLK